MEKHFLGFLDGGDPERGSVGGVPPEFLQHAVLPAYGTKSLGIHLAFTWLKSVEKGHLIFPPCIHVIYLQFLEL
jgi:hypothetical protein